MEPRYNYADVVNHVEAYLRVYLPEYDLMEIRQKSAHPDDAHLYIVAARNKNNKTYAVWSSWNESTKSMNHGTYMIPDWKTCRKTIDEKYNN